MKKLFCMLTVVCMLVTLVAVETISVSAIKEQDEQILVGAEPTATATETEAEPATTAMDVTPVLYGDANDDGEINMKDVLALRKYLAEIPVDLNWEASDANRDGKVNMKDVLLLRQYIAGIANYFEWYDPAGSVPFTLEERVEIGGSELMYYVFPKAVLLCSPEDVETYFSHTENIVDASKTATPKGTYDEAFFAGKFLLALRVYDGSLDKSNPLTAMDRGADGSLLAHVRQSEVTEPWTMQDALLISMPLSELDTVKTLYELYEVPLLDEKTWTITGYALSQNGGVIEVKSVEDAFVKHDIFDADDYLPMYGNPGDNTYLECMCFPDHFCMAHRVGCWAGDGYMYTIFDWNHRTCKDTRMEDFTAEDHPLCDYNEAPNSVPIVFIEGLPNIGDYLFFNHPTVSMVCIPDSVKEIGEHAFCDNCKTIIGCHKGSYAESYAKAHGLTVKIIE